MSDGYDPISVDQCTPPGTIGVTQQALDYAERFQKAVPAGWIVAFSWYDGGRTKANKDAPWIETGPGLDLGGYKIEQIPPEAVWQTGSLRYAVLIREAVLADHPERTIDLNARGTPILR